MNWSEVRERQQTIFKTHEEANLRARWGIPSHSLRLRQRMLRKSSITRRTSKSSRSSFRLDFPRRRPSESKAETRMKPVLVKITVGGVLAELNGVSELETSFIDRRGGRLKGTTTMKAEEDRALRNALLRRSLVGERKRDEGANNKRGRTLQTIVDEGKLRFMLSEDEIMDRSTVGKGIRSRVWLSRSWSIVVPTSLRPYGAPFEDIMPSSYPWHEDARIDIRSKNGGNE